MLCAAASVRDEANCVPSACCYSGRYVCDTTDKLEATEVQWSFGLCVRELIHNKLGYKLVDSDIEVAHRLGSYQSNKDRAVIVRFNSRKVTEEVTSRRRALKGSGIVIAEDLTKINAARYKKVRELSGVVRAWTKREGGGGGRFMPLAKTGSIQKNTINGVVPVQQGVDRPGKCATPHNSPPGCASGTPLRDASHTTGACSPGAAQCGA